MSQLRRDHWQAVYQTKRADGVSWFQAEAKASIDGLNQFQAGPAQSFIDIGGGASVLVGELAKAGWEDLTVLDISEAALELSRANALQAGDNQIEFIAADITQWSPQRSYSIWHDRAVFHFLTDPADRTGYKQALCAGLEQGGHAIIATFALDGPEKCSDLPVQRYNAQSLSKELGECFALLEEWNETHITPWGAQQSFQWCVFRKETQ